MKKFIYSLALCSTLTLLPTIGHAKMGDMTLKPGMNHADVKQLQEALKKKGYFKGNTTTYYGNITKDAVYRFEKANKLPADGIAGRTVFRLLGSSTASVSVNKSAQVVKEAKKYAGTPYKWGGTTPKGFDCSGYLNYVYEKAAGVNLSRTVEGIYKQGTKVSKPQVGDIVFFETYKPGASHAGIYIGNGQFIHSSSSKGVSVASMSSSYWSKRYIGSKSFV
ncbi:C40 family peptidase [Priestia abyssalis]|uniref:C40 family peptidase n=1 Tax=Priestia abyssalis TaxID=1221450 RepID=UPI0009951B9E|nr:NlpC/P60 family protein [Priestia abyssalis]